MALLTRLSLINRLVVALLSVAIVVFGVIATLSLKQELLPSITAPQAVVIVQYPGASPDIVADEAAAPIEQAVRNVSGVTSVDSLSSTNSSQITVMWEYGQDDDKVLGEINSAVSAAKSSLPDDVETEVFAGSTDDIPVVQLAVSSDLELDRFGPLVDDVAVSALSGLPGVREVTLTGQDTKQITVTLKQDRLDDHELTAQAVNQSVQAQLKSMPAGTSFDGNDELSVEVGSTPGSVDAIKKLPIATADGPVRLSELADVRLESVSRSSISRADGRPSLGLAVMKTPDADTVQISHAVQNALPGLQDELGNNAAFSTVFDQAPMIEQSLHDLAVEGGLGLAFAILVILLFLLSVRSTIITAISIPLSLLIAMIGLWIGEYSLNLFTLAALTVAVGRVVDDSIVVIENIKRHSLGAHRLTIDQVVASVKEVAGAVTASTLTTVAVFLPVAFVSGSTGELFRPFSITVAIALAASLLVSLTIVPLLAYWFLRGRKPKAGAAAPAEEDPERVTRLQRGYLPVLGWSLRHPVITLAISLLIFIATLGASTLLKTDFLGSLGDDRAVQINQELPSGTRLESTAEAATKIEKILADDPDVKSYQSTIGQAGKPNVVTYSVTLADEADAGAATERLRSKVAEVPDSGEVRLTSATAAYTSNDVTVTLTGDDSKALSTATTAVQQAVAGIPGLSDVRTDLAEQRPVLRVKVDLTKAADYGFTQTEIGTAVAAALQGSPVGDIVLDGETHDVVIRTHAPNAKPSEIGRLKLPVSQVQQQKAMDKAQDALEEKSDDLERKQEDLKQRQEDLQDRQKEQAEEAKQDAEEQGEDQRRDLEQSKEDAESDLAELRDQLRDLRNSPEPTPPPPPAPPQPGQPPQPGGIPVTQEQLAYQKQLEQRAQAIAQLESAVRQSEQGIEQIEDQLEAMQDQQEQSEQQEQDQQEITDEQEAIVDDQEALAEEQQELAEEQQDLADLKAKAITVGDVAKVVKEKTPVTVKHVDGQRAVTITATPTGADLGTVSASLMTVVDRVDLPAGVAVEQGGASTEQQEAFVQLGLAMLLAIVLVFIIMVATFRSLLQPLILLVSIPFAATGALVGLLATNTALGVPAMVGLLMLIGIVVTNAIVLIDLINTYRERGAEPQAAIIDGARLRLRPIIMTAAATICALTPMAFGLTGGGVFISRPLAVVVIGGLVSSTILTLILVPVLYSLVSKIGYKPPAPAADPNAGDPDRDESGAAVPQRKAERDTVFPVEEKPRRDA